jgi:S-(hydroxymethyl)glutathione dehydrogenase/alcohol dehydrogenase
LPTFFQSASFAAHVVIDAGRVSIIPSSVAFDAASLVPCGVMTGVGAALNVAKVEAESQVIVVGMGSIGLNAIQGARIAKARTIIAIDTNPAKEAVARLFGATHFINPSTSDMPLHKQIYAIAGGKVDYAFDCVGHPKLLEQVMSLVDPYWGVVVAVGIAPFDQQITLPATTFYNGRALLGTYMGDFNPKTDTSRLVGLYQSGELLLDKLITHRLPLEEINEGFAMMKSGQSIRSVIIY